MRKTQLTLLAIFAAFFIQAQDVDEIINSYFENTGGYENWGKLQGIKTKATLSQGGGMEFPMEIVQMADGRQYTSFEVQGNKFKQGVYDGNTVWSTNFQSLQAEEADAETIANTKLDANDFPDELYDYKKKGYTVELLGTETMDGAEVYKIKLTKENKVFDGEEVEDVTFYYFDVDNMVPIAQEAEIKQGPQKGAIVVVKYSDYDEVDGFYFPFSLTQGIKGGPSQPFKIESIEINPEVDDSEFTFPGQ